MNIKYIAFITLIFFNVSCNRNSQEFPDSFLEYNGDYHYTFSEYNNTSFISNNEINHEFGIRLKDDKLLFFRDNKLIRQYNYFGHSFVTNKDDYDLMIFYKKKNKSFMIYINTNTYETKNEIITQHKPVSKGLNYFLRN